jgi:peptide-methionine (S)-S-oxide reductase
VILAADKSNSKLEKKKEGIAMSEGAQEVAVFAGGCFWCMEPLFDRLEGVISTLPGYTGGTTSEPSYSEVCEGNTGHLEAVKIVFDPSKIGYSQLLDLFWRHIDPLDPDGQFCDKGEQYLSAIFYVDEQQRSVAKRSKEEIAKALKGLPIYTQIRPLSIFYPAEDYHREFYLKDPLRYKSYSSCCGRVERLRELWGQR